MGRDIQNSGLSDTKILTLLDLPVELLNKLAIELNIHDYHRFTSSSNHFKQSLDVNPRLRFSAIKETIEMNSSNALRQDREQQPTFFLAPEDVCDETFLYITKNGLYAASLDCLSSKRMFCRISKAALTTFVQLLIGSLQDWRLHEAQLCSVILRVLEYQDKIALNTLLFNTCQLNLLQLSQVIVGDPRVDFNFRLKGRTLLHTACHWGQAGIVKILLNNTQLLPNCLDPIGKTPLHYACVYGHKDIVDILLNDSRVLPNARDYNLLTPLHSACIKGHENVVEILLVDPRIDPSALDSQGKTPLHEACLHNKLSIVKMLCDDPRVSPNAIDQEGRSPLHLASIRGNHEVVDLLARDSRVITNLPDSKGQSPLHATFADWRNGETVGKYRVVERLKDLN